MSLSTSLFLSFFPALTAAAAATVPAFPYFPRQSTKSPPLHPSDEIGCSPAFTYQYFDPLNFSVDDPSNFSQYREAELKHGRIAMLATIGMAVPDLLRENVVPHGALLSPSRDVRFDDVPYGLGAIQAVPREGWIQIVTFVGFLETVVFVMRDANDMPGDYGVGYFGLRDKARHERSLQSELENGRLAMVAFVGQVIAELVTGRTLGDVWRGGLDGKGPPSLSDAAEVSDGSVSDIVEVLAGIGVADSAARDQAVVELAAHASPPF